MRKRVLLCAFATLIAGAAVAGPMKHPLKGSRLMPMAKISLVTARAAAIAARPGLITDQELERESGGSGLRFSFDINSHGKTFEVGIDAKTGAVLENIAEGAHAD